MSTPAPEQTAVQTPADTFSAFGPALVAALAEQGITEPTPVQSAVIPDALSGHDVLGRARTGSGKTLAFGLPILHRLAGRRSRPCHPRAVIIVPTRELATQVARAIMPLASAAGLRLATVYGGTPYERQTRQLRQRADLVVATPGRLEDLLEQGYCFFDDIEMTVLDEADHLCDLGFYPAIDKLVGMTPAGSQRMLLSATLDGDVDKLVRTHLRAPRLHELDPNAGAVTTMTHHTLVVAGFRAKVDAAVDLVRANGRSIVFTRTREGAIDLAAALSERGVTAVDLHGDLSQRVRERNLQRFSGGQAQAVVATDVAARGIHVDNVDLVVHFDAANDPKAYLHRSGRTARAGADGCVVTLTTPKMVHSVVRLQQGASVDVLHHDARTAPKPMTAEALAESGHPGPVGGHPQKDRAQSDRAQSGRSQSGYSQSGRSSQGRSSRPGQGRGQGSRPGKGHWQGKSAGAGGRKPHRGQGGTYSPTTTTR
jgi:superfamily II DNA/RNA helicase